MKKYLTLLLFATLLIGCRHLQPGADPILVEAEQLAINSEMSIDKFLLLEDEKRILINNNDIYLAAEYVRHNAPNWLLTLREVTERYRLSKTAETRQSLQFYISFLRQTIVDVDNRYNSIK